MKNYWLDKKQKERQLSLMEDAMVVYHLNPSIYQKLDVGDEAKTTYPEIYGFKTLETDEIGGTWQNDGWGE